jgi:hypothetical protein
MRARTGRQTNESAGPTPSIKKRNCWEVMGCGREPGGEYVHELGVCPAAEAVEHHGINGGDNAGRFCWYVAGTFCSGTVQGTHATKFESCLRCPFLREVVAEEGGSLIFMALGGEYYRLEATTGSGEPSVL